MATKAKTVFYCTSCGNESPKWMGRCPACGEWNTMKEAPVEAKKGGASGGSRIDGARPDRRPQRLHEIDDSQEARISLGMGEVDRILGGGMVRGSLVLIGGEPGIGKSTLSLQIPLCSKDLRTLYVTGEESARQVGMRARRLGGDDGNCSIFCETLIETVIEEARAMMPDLMIVDSVQTMYSDTLDSAPGSVSQIKEVAAALLRFAKESGVPVILIGHITKDGFIAGPKILEHIVDVVLQFEGENRGSYRILRSIKNRFGSTAELAVFEMTGTGLREVANPSELLIPMHERHGFRRAAAEHAAGRAGEACRLPPGRQGRVPEHGRRPEGERPGGGPRRGVRRAFVEFRFRHPAGRVLCGRSGPERRDPPCRAGGPPRAGSRPAGLQAHLRVFLRQSRGAARRHPGGEGGGRARAGESPFQIAYGTVFQRRYH